MKYTEGPDLLLGAAREAEAQSSQGQVGFTLLPGEAEHPRTGQEVGIQALQTPGQLQL